MLLKQQATGWGQKKKRSRGEEREKERGGDKLLCNYTSQDLGGVLESYGFLRTNCVTVGGRGV